MLMLILLIARDLALGVLVYCMFREMTWELFNTRIPREGVLLLAKVGYVGFSVYLLYEAARLIL